MTGSNNVSNPSNMQDNITKSRKIHQQMMNKKNRWRPSELELALLKLHFQKNQYPSKEEKEGILNTLERQFGTKVHIDQLSRWFQHEREKAMARNSKIICKNTYRKFGKEELDYLQESFVKNNYPKMEEMIAMAKRLNVNLSKIENWYKHNRRTLAKHGQFALKTKKYFKKEELSYLVEMFENHPRPTKEQLLEIAEKLNCTESQIKNWYSNKRKKLKLISKKHGYESTDTSYSLDQSVFSKASYYSEPASIPLQVPIINPTLPFQPAEISPKINEPRQLASAPLLMNNPIAGPQQAQAIFSGYTSTGIPILVVPASMSNSSSMIVNTNIIDNPNNQNPIPVSNNELNLNAKEIKSSHMFQDFKNAGRSPPEFEKAKLMTPPSLISPFAQSNTIGTFQNKVFFPNASILPINTTSPPNSIESIQNPWYKPVQIHKPELEFAKKIQPNMGVITSPLPMMGPTLSPKVDLSQGLGAIGNLAGNLIPLSAANGISLIPAINSFPTQSNLGFTASESNLKSINALTQIAPSIISPQKPIQVQYQTSLYLPFSNNNIYSQYPPVMMQPGSEFYFHGPAQPQMHINTFIPAGSAASSQQK